MGAVCSKGILSSTASCYCAASACRSVEHPARAAPRPTISPSISRACSSPPWWPAPRPDRIFGFDQSQVRERVAGLFYSDKTLSRAAHVVDRNLDLAAACRRASGLLRLSRCRRDAPKASCRRAISCSPAPLAGWGSKQWPLAHYRALAGRLRRELGRPLVLNGPPGAAILPQSEGALPHHSSLPGLIYATRRAAAVVGVDSGPLHLAAALGKPGVAIFGPTDPARNGPYGDSLRVLRSAAAVTTYKRGAAIDSSMRQISPDEVFEALRTAIGTRGHPAEPPE